jgi:hypothetical protein
MVAVVNINENGHLIAIKEVSDIYRTIPYNWEEKPRKYEG